MSDRPFIVVTDFIQEPLTTEREIFGEEAEVIAVDAQHEQELQGVVERASALMVYHAISVTSETIQRLENCQLIVRCGVGYDNVDGTAARQRGITLANVPDYGTEEVADSAIAMTLGLTRGTHYMNSRLQRSVGPWSYTQVQPLTRLRQQIFGVVGLGRIGIATTLRAKALGFDVWFYDPYVPEGMDKTLGIRRTRDIAELAAQSYVLSLHCPSTEETRQLVTRDVLWQMPRGGYVINTARGSLLQPELILEALESGQLAGAGIDVLPVEPPQVDDPLVNAWRDPTHPAYDRLILNPHAAFYCEQGLQEMRVKGSRNCLRVLRGEPPVNVVN